MLVAPHREIELSPIYTVLVEGWRRHVDELTMKYPSVKYVVTLEKYVCGDRDVTSLYDRRMLKFAVIPIRTAARICGRTT